METLNAVKHAARNGMDVRWSNDGYKVSHRVFPSGEVFNISHAGTGGCVGLTGDYDPADFYIFGDAVAADDAAAASRADACDAAYVSLRLPNGSKLTCGMTRTYGDNGDAGSRYVPFFDAYAAQIDDTVYNLTQHEATEFLRAQSDGTARALAITENMVNAARAMLAAAQSANVVGSDFRWIAGR